MSASFFFALGLLLEVPFMPLLITRNIKAAAVSTLANLILASFPLLPLHAETLSWDTSVLETRAYNRALLAAEHDYRAAQFKVESAHSGYYPQLSLDLGANRSSSSGFNMNDGSGVSIGSPALSGGNGGPRTTTSAAFNLSQNIFSGFKTEAEVESAAASMEVSRADLDIARAKASYDLKSAFAALLYSQNYVKLAQSIIRRREENLSLVELRYQNGNENKGSYLLSRAAWADAKLGSLQAENLIQSSRQQLAAVLGRENSDDLEVAGDVPYTDPPRNPVFQALLSETPEDRKSVAQKNLADAQFKLAQSGFYPSVDVSGQSGYRDQGSGLAGKDNWQFGIQFSYPLFTGGRDYYGRKSAQESVNAAISQRVGTAQQLRVKLKSAWTAYLEAVERVQVSQEFVEAATSRAEIARARYNNGLLSFEDWDLIENDLITRQKNLLLSQRDRIVAEAAWEQAQGKGVLQ